MDQWPIKFLLGCMEGVQKMCGGAQMSVEGTWWSGEGAQMNVDGHGVGRGHGRCAKAV